MPSRRGLPTGVQRKHTRSCAARTDATARCRCRGGYQVQAGPRGARKTRTFPTLDAAVSWKRDMDVALASGRLSRTRAPTLREAATRWSHDADIGVALARGQKPYRPSTMRDYRRSLDVDVLPVLGAKRLDELTRGALNEFVGSLSRRGLAPSTVRNVVMPLRAIYRHALDLELVAVNPTIGMKVPTGSGRRMRVVEPARIGAYLQALPECDRALWATAIYAGLRRGELMALRWADADLAAGLIRIDPDVGGYDQKTKTAGAPKSAAGARRVPISGALRELLVEHRARAGARPRGLVFARGSLDGGCRKGTEALPFNDSSIGPRAVAAWNAAGLPPVSLHDCRHTFASLMIAAMAGRGIFNPKLLQQVMGHSSIQVTFDRYGHLFPGQEAEVGVMLDEFLATATSDSSTTSEATKSEAGLERPEVTDHLAAAGERAVDVQREPFPKEAR